MKEVHETEDERSAGEIARDLRKLVRHDEDIAYVAGVKQARTVKRWVEHDVTPKNPETEQRMRVAESLAKVVKDETRSWVSAAWLIAHNPYLGEQSPTELIHSLSGTDSDTLVLENLHFAAKEFSEHTS